MNFGPSQQGFRVSGPRAGKSDQRCTTSIHLHHQHSRGSCSPEKCCHVLSPNLCLPISSKNSLEAFTEASIQKAIQKETLCSMFTWTTTLALCSKLSINTFLRCTRAYSIAQVHSTRRTRLFFPSVNRQAAVLYCYTPQFMYQSFENLWPGIHHDHMSVFGVVRNPLMCARRGGSYVSFHVRAHTSTHHTK